MVAWTPELREKVKRWRRNGRMTIGDMASRVGVTRGAMARACYRYGITKARLPEWLPNYILRHHQRGLSDEKMAEIAGVHRRTIQGYRRRLGLPAAGNLLSATAAERRRRERDSAGEGWPKNAMLRHFPTLAALLRLGAATAGQVRDETGARHAMACRMLNELVQLGHVAAEGRIRSRVYTLRESVADAYEEATSNRRRPLPDVPTGHWPGTPEKIEVFHNRNRRGFQLYHPRDADPDAVNVNRARFLERIADVAVEADEGDPWE